MNNYKCNINTQKEGFVKVWHMCGLIIKEYIEPEDEELKKEMANEMFLFITELVLESIIITDEVWEASARSPVGQPDQAFAYAVKVDSRNRIIINIEVSVDQPKALLMFANRMNWAELFEE